MDWRRATIILAETAREVGVLVLVFAPLEATFSGVTVRWDAVLSLGVFGLVLIASGILLEVRRR